VQRSVLVLTTVFEYLDIPCKYSETGLNILQVCAAKRFGVLGSCCRACQKKKHRESVDAIYIIYAINDDDDDDIMTPV